MILQSLNEYYDRKEKDLPPFGFEMKPIPFLVEIDKQGRFINLVQTGEIVGKKVQPQMFEVPKGKGRAGSKSYETAYLLWDHYGYVLNQPKVDKPDAEPSSKAIDDAGKQHHRFKSQIEQLHSDLPNDEGVAAVFLFLNSPEQISRAKQHEHWLGCLKIKGCNLAFKLVNDAFLVCQSAHVIDWVKSQPLPEENISQGHCLVTGEQGDIVRLHDFISGVAPKPAPLAAINDSAYCSYGKNKGFNFPVSAEASFKYATALNHLLRKGSPNRFRLLDTTFVSWAEKASPMAELLPLWINDSGDDPDVGVNAVKSLFNTIYNGAYQEDDAQERLHLLGLSPNSARIVIRFWNVGTVADFAQKLAKWFKDLEIDGYEKFGYPGFQKLLRATALQYKDDNVSPNLPTELLRSILNNTPLPESYLQAVIRRIKAEQGDITFTRVSGLKAYLIRKKPVTSKKEEIQVSLNKENKEIGYCLGRLFATYEKIQIESEKPRLINAGIKDKFYVSASTTPHLVFGRLEQLSGFHMSKLKKNKPNTYKFFDQKLIEVMDMVDVSSPYPKNFSLEQQALFAVGYYHQKQDFFKPKTNIDTKKESDHELTK